MIALSTHRDVFRLHHAACASCHELFAFARAHDDREALQAWRRQLAQHLDADHERREYDLRVRKLLVGGAWNGRAGGRVLGSAQPG